MEGRKKLEKPKACDLATRSLGRRVAKGGRTQDIRPSDVRLVAFFRWTWEGALEREVISSEIHEDVLVLKRSRCLLGKTFALCANSKVLPTYKNHIGHRLNNNNTSANGILINLQKRKQ